MWRFSIHLNPLPVTPPALRRKELISHSQYLIPPVPHLHNTEEGVDSSPAIHETSPVPYLLHNTNIPASTFSHLLHTTCIPDRTCCSPAQYEGRRSWLVTHNTFFYPHTCNDYQQAISSDALDECTPSPTYTFSPPTDQRGRKASASPSFLPSRLNWRASRLYKLSLFSRWFSPFAGQCSSRFAPSC